MRKRFLRIIFYASLLFLFIAAILPLIASWYIKLYPDRLIYKKGIPQILEKIENDDLSCSIFCPDSKVLLSRDQLRTMREYIKHFFKDVNITTYIPSVHTRDAFYYVRYWDAHHHILTILIYCDGSEIEIHHDNEILVFTVEKQELLRLLAIITDICPSPYANSFINNIRQNDR